MNVVNAVYPEPEQAKAFFMGEEDGPFVMVNLLKFKPKATYEDGSNPDMTSKEAYEIYGDAVGKMVEALGGKPTAGVGFALGLNRTLLACDDEGVFAPPSTAVDVFVVDTTGGLEALRITAELRAAGLRSDRAFENRSMKSQMKAADRSGAAFAVIVGSNRRESINHKLAEALVKLAPAD